MLFVLLPAFNEEDSLPQLLPEIDQSLRKLTKQYRIVVVNDGSSDRTAQILQELQKSHPLEIISHRINRGLGETSRDAFEWAAENASDTDVLIRMDCDCTHEPEYFSRLISKLEEGYDVVITSRFQPGGGQIGVSRYRAFISYTANLLMKIIFQVPNVKEYSCGFRAYRAEIIKEAIRFFGNDFIQLKGLGFTCTIEKLIKLNLLGARFAEVPFVLRYDKKLSVSKMVTSVTALGYLVLVICYHWPFGGWRTGYKRLLREYRSSQTTKPTYTRASA